LRGMETETSRRLCWRAPRTWMCVRFLRGISVEEAKFLVYKVIRRRIIESLAVIDVIP
jgi:hypothetical protein